MGQSQSNVTARPMIRVLSRDEAVQALQEAEATDHFRGDVGMDVVNNAARKGLFYSPVPTVPAVDLGQVNIRTPIRIVWMDSSAEGGMPHTRWPDVVCIPVFWPEFSLAKTILHESIHVDQRARPNVWIEWCIREGWTLIEESEIPERWLRRCRLNPDTMKYRFWAYQNRWVPLPLYEREDKPVLRDVHVFWWDRTTGVLHKDPPRAIAEYVESIGTPEHPFEIAAYKEIQL